MDPITWIGWIVWFVVTYIQIYEPASSANSDWFNKTYTRIGYAPPKWVYFYAWIILYALMSVAIGLFWQDVYFQSLANYNLVITMYLINIILNKLWTLIFFQAHLTLFALIIILLVLISAIVVFILFIIDVAIISAVFFGIYILWLLFATALNLGFYVTENKPHTETPKIAVQVPRNTAMGHSYAKTRISDEQYRQYQQTRGRMINNPVGYQPIGPYNNAPINPYTPPIHYRYPNFV